MKTNPFYIAKLLIKKYSGQLTPHEQQELNRWFKKDKRNVALYEELHLTAENKAGIEIFHQFDEDKAWSAILKKTQKSNRVPYLKIAVAALLVFSLGFYLFKINTTKQDIRIIVSKDSKYQNDILPADSRARIILADGREMEVDNNVIVNDRGQIADVSQKVIMDAEVTSPLSKNTLVVPAAKFFKMTLSDGTKVWVNANSELSFPTTFPKNERRISLKGEAYFEVAKDANRPFYVDLEKQQSVKVLGTHFNIKSREESSRTTLAEGKVSFTSNLKTVVLAPGQYAQSKGLDIKVAQADLEKELAWKNNEFFFKGDNIVEIAKQLQAWYNLEVSFAKDVSLSQTYSGQIRRNANLSEVLNMLSFVSNLNFKIESNKLTIQNKK